MDNIILGFLTLYIHFFSSVLWWGITFFVFFILRPVNREGSYSLILPRIHRFILPISTISILSGITLTFININFDPYRLFTIWGYLLIVGGLFSIPVYLFILYQSKPGNIKIQLNKKENFKKKILPPYLLFILLSITMLIMVFVTNLFS
jgi:uncharacterized protein (DUF486 family)